MPEDVLQDYEEGYDADMVCEMVVCVEGAEVRELKWLPFSCCDEVSSSLFARTFADQTVRFRKRMALRNAYPRSESSRPCFVPAKSRSLPSPIPKSYGQGNRRRPRTTCLLRLSVCIDILVGLR